jgi:hypothetical protein
MQVKPAAMASLKGLLTAALLVMAGCVTLPWVPAEARYTPRGKDYSVELPQGWMRFNMDGDDDVLVTRDGERLQAILIERLKVDKELRHTKKKLTRGMMPQEVAEVILDNFASDRRYASFEVQENRPAAIGGQPGFRAVFTRKTKGDALKVKTVFCGFMKGDVLYGFQYTAPERHYFGKDIKSFEKVLQSFTLAKAA